jgi:hypothetical protein
MISVCRTRVPLQAAIRAGDKGRVADDLAARWRTLAPDAGCRFRLRGLRGWREHGDRHVAQGSLELNSWHFRRRCSGNCHELQSARWPADAIGVSQLADGGTAGSA